MITYIQKFILSTTFALAIFTSCESDTSLLNNDKKHFSEIPSSSLLSMGQYQSFYYLDVPNATDFRFFVQYWSETTYTDNSNYNLVTDRLSEKLFNKLYVEVLNNFNQAKINLEKEENIPDVANNKWAINEISSIFIWQVIVDLWGDVPYSEALRAIDGVYSPKYDDAKYIYEDLIGRIDIAVDRINTSAEGYGANDLVYGGDMKKWIKLANTIKLRLAINLSDVDPVIAKTHVESAINAGVIGSREESYSFVYDGAQYSNPVYDNLVSSRRDDYVPSNIIIDKMNSKNDPRRDIWFTKHNGNFIGGIYGKINNFADLSHVTDIFKQPTTPTNLLSYSEVLFLKAEAYERGFDVGDTSENLYKSAITESMLEYGVNSADISTYIYENPYNSADWEKSIGEEAWIALYNRSLASWNFVRRLDYPKLVNPEKSNTSIVPIRMIYPSYEYSRNNKNIIEAANKIGGDNPETKIFWDVN